MLNQHAPPKRSATQVITLSFGLGRTPKLAEACWPEKREECFQPSVPAQRELTPGPLSRGLSLADFVAVGVRIRSRCRSNLDPRRSLSAPERPEAAETA